MKKLKGALIGTGMISEFHIKAWQRIKEVEIIALVNSNLTSAIDKRNRFLPNAAVYSSFDEVIKAEEIDFVDIVTPPQSHFSYVMEAVKHNLHVICQKPLCDNYEDAKLLVESLKNYPKLFAVHENHRFRPWFIDLLNYINNGTIGEIKLVKAIQLSPQLPNIPYKLQSSKGVLLEHGTHLIDLVHALLGSPCNVSSRMHYLSAKSIGETYAHVVLEYPNALATIDVGWKTHGGLQAMFMVHGSEGEAYYTGSMVRGESACFKIYNRNELVVNEERDPNHEYQESFFNFEKECTRAMLNQDDFNVSRNAEENLKTLETTFLAYKNFELLKGKEVI